MDRKKKFDKEEAKLMLNSNPDAAALWLASGEHLNYRLPDPLYSMSRTWKGFEVETNPLSDQNTNEGQAFQIDTEKPKQKIQEKPSAEQAETISILSPELSKKPLETTESSQDEPKPIKKPVPKKGTKKPKSTKATEHSEESKETRKRKKHKKSVAGPVDFYSWLSSLNPEENEVPISKPLQKAISGKSTTKKISKSTNSKTAKASKSDEPVSETLAKLLARQGHRTQAISMYKKLMKKFPQKELTFAAAIKKIKS